MPLSRSEVLPSSDVGLPLSPARPESVNSCSSDENIIVPNDTESHSSSCTESKVTFATLATFSPSKIRSAIPLMCLPSVSLFSCSGNNNTCENSRLSPSVNGEAQMSRFMKLAKKFNCFYFGGDLKLARALIVGEKQVGLVQPNVLEAVRRHPDVFLIDSITGNVFIHPSLASYEERSERIDSILRQWREESTFVTLKGWRDECYEVRAGFAEPPLLKMERAATCLFGIRQYGVDINGYTRQPHLGVCLWLQRRSCSKPTWPGKWDNMVGGGLSVGHSVLETALKEAAEEASIPAHLLLHIKAAGVVSFYFESERGLFPNTEFVFDLELPSDFVPSNADGEVESFELVPVAQVMERILSPDFKTTSCPVTLDFLIRHGFINSDNEPHLPELIELLHIPLHLIYSNRVYSPMTSFPSTSM